MQKQASQTPYKNFNPKVPFLILAIVLAVSLIGNFMQVVNRQRATSTGKLNPFPMLDPARRMLEDEDAIVNVQSLRTYLNELTAKEKDIRTSIYFELFTTGANISVNPNERIYPASLVKLPVSLAAVYKVQTGNWQWHNQLVLLKEDMDSGSGDLHTSTIGTRYTIEELVKRSLIDSDNTAYSILRRNISGEDIEKVIQETGLEDLSDEKGLFSAKEYSRFFRILYTASFLNEENSTKVLTWLNSSTFKDFLNQGLPEDVKFSHKYGENKEQRAYSDSGIVYLENRPYMLSVMIKELENKTEVESFEHAKKLMKEISERTYYEIKNH